MVTEQQVWEALRHVMDPEVPFSVVDLGLVYGVTVTADARVTVQLTLTTRGCPLVRRISDDARDTIARLVGAAEVRVEIVWDPPWNPGMASEEVRSRLGWG